MPDAYSRAADVQVGRRIKQLTASRLVTPHPPPSAVVRTRILDMIDRGVRGPVTLVSAPAGTGKTVALAEWVASGRAPGPVVWITLGVDADVRRLWTLLSEGLHRHDLVARGSLPDATVATQDAFLTALISEVAGFPVVVTLVLDSAVEFSLDVANGLHQLLTGAGDRLRLITLTRADPMLPLHLYRLNEAVVEIRMADLAFTADEVQQLLSVRGTALPAEVVEQVVARTNGWVTGLLMISTSLARAPDPLEALARANGGSGPVAEYLLEEVVSSQPPVVRELLLRTSVVETLRPEVAEALSGPNASRVLAFLSHGNAFIDELPSRPGWYRYHPLLRELLAAELTRQDQVEATRLHLVAADWYAAHGFRDEAVRTAIAAEAWDHAATTVVDDRAIAYLLPICGSDELRDLFTPMPSDAASTAALLVRAALKAYRQDYEGCAEDLRIAGERLDNSDPWPAAALTVWVLATVCTAASGAPAEAVLDAAGMARDLLNTDEHTAVHRELVLAVEDAAADALFREGRFPEAAKACDTGLAAAIAGFEAGQVSCLGRLAFIAAWSGHCRRAIKLARRASDLRAGTRPAWGISVLPDLALAIAHADRGELEEAGGQVSAIELAAEDAPSASEAALAHVMDGIVRSRIRRARRDLPAARAAVLEFSDRELAAPTWATDQVVVEEAVVDLIEGHVQQALDIPDDLAAPVREVGRLVRAEAELMSGMATPRGGTRHPPAAGDLSLRVQGWLVEALSRTRRGDQPGCAETLDRALRLAAPEHLRRPFLEAPEPIRRALSTRSELAARHSWLFSNARNGRVRTPTADRSAGVPTQVPGFVVQLTAKEQEVLGLLAQLFTTEETAAAMYVSVNTVRTHVRNILRKLGVKGRNEAIRRARDLGILHAA